MSMRELPADTCVCRMGQLYINEVVLGTAIGVLFGPYCANIFNPRSWGGDINVITLEVMRVTLAAGLFAIGVELPQSYLWEHVRGLLVMVVPTMAFGWLVVAGMSLFRPRTQCKTHGPSRNHLRCLPADQLRLVACHRGLSHAHGSYHLCCNRRYVRAPRVAHICG